MAFPSTDWALILGGSSGFGLATARALAGQGMSVLVVHRDLRGAMARIDGEFEAIRTLGSRFCALNLDALSDDGRGRVLETLQDVMGAGGRVKVLLHSIAHGNLKSLVPAQDSAPHLEDEDVARTIYAMGTNLLTWVQSLHQRSLFASDARVFSLTSEGSHVAWAGYAAVSAAKAALESVSRSIAVEFAPFGIRCNVIQAGITDTPALRHIPGSDQMKEWAKRRNPFRRLTEPTDVANFIALMARPEAAWVNGAILRVDGGEGVASPPPQ